ITFAFFTLLWAGMPSPGQGIYWVTGGVENLLSIALMLLLLAGLLRAANHASALRQVTLTCSLAILAFVATGFHEMYSCLFCFVLLIGTVIAFLHHLQNRWQWALILAAAVLGILFVVAAPGNYLRSQHFPLRHDVARTVRIGGKQMLG